MSGCGLMKAHSSLRSGGLVGVITGLEKTALAYAGERGMTILAMKNDSLVPWCLPSAAVV